MEDPVDWGCMEYDSDVEEGRRTPLVGSIAYRTEQPPSPNPSFGSSCGELDDGSHHIQVCIVFLLIILVCGQTCTGFLLTLYMLVPGHGSVGSNTCVCS